MTQADRDRLVAVKKAAKGLITRKQAAEELKLSERQVYRVVAAWRKGGDKAVVHQLRGRESHRKLDEEVEQKAIEILRQSALRDWGPTLASQYLARKHGMGVSKETLRKWMMEAGLWHARKQRIQEVHVWRPRRERFGELVQWDTSEHDWLEGRGELRYLVAMIDDATSRIFARFVRHDSTEENMAVLEQYLRRFGRPLEFYTDKASIFHTTPKKNNGSREEPLPPTQIGRALQELNIGWIAAHSPQAKGRVERSFQTAQDRLVKLMRAEGIGGLEEANADLDSQYLPEWESLFSKIPVCVDDAHRPLGKLHDLAAILCRVETRVVTNDYTFRFGAHIYQIAREQVRPRLRGATVRVEQRRNGELMARFEDNYLQISACEPPASKTALPRKPKSVRAGTGKAHKAGGKSQWMKGFWKRKAPDLDQAIAISNATN
ncbi:MAG: ISNCY family transposase [Rubrobacter sp.]|nr:ISNCY family transposase [Rubrobacter sp.]